MKKINFGNFLIKLSFIILSFIMVSCDNNDDPDPIPIVIDGYSKGIFIVNEGPFQSGTGTITYMSRDGSEVVQKVYQSANMFAPLGNIVQSMNVYPIGGEEAFITVNNANLIEVVNLKSFQSVQSIENIVSPRHFEFSQNGKIYISSWDNTVKILSLNGYESIGQINVGTGPEKMLWTNDKLWVLNQGGFSVDSTISIIDTDTDELIHTLQVYDKPTGIQKDENGMIWVLCSGNGWNGFPGADDSEAHLLCINPDNYNFIKDISFPSTTEHPEKLVINEMKNNLFYNHVDGIYRFDIHDFDLEEHAFIQRNVMFYGLGLDPFSNVIYASDPVDYVQNGWVYRYDANSGAMVDSVEAGVIPGEFFFSNIPTGK